jgi:leucyl-tRNA synthetase
VDAEDYRLCDRLLEVLEELDWPESIKEMQRNWIGKFRRGACSFCGRRHRRNVYGFHNAA